MKRLAFACLCLLVAVLALAGCRQKVTPPPMPQVASPVPGPGASPLEVERHQLEEEKRGLTEQYGDNLARIQQINARLIEINIEINRRQQP
ncbi:hypothetical protein [Solidesulfovibrio sp.]|uniref:hypothetical protein n=1 Tax=Solidesulfovibrio sp. TaxID=2910990 RepID=UPI002B20C78C|nr:hypothetical protein [Solidesulfovibrio sp.]MEA4856538.1 hypothetical protein [Solidesulfovibrio sp.]